MKELKLLVAHLIRTKQENDEAIKREYKGFDKTYRMGIRQGENVLIEEIFTLTKNRN